MSERSHEFNEMMSQLRKIASRIPTQEHLDGVLLMIKNREDRQAIFSEVKKCVPFENPTCPQDVIA